jgi:DNA-binding Lrp family transcriptional regulator
VPKPKPSTVRLQVFKGHKAKLNKAIFTILASRSPQTIYDIHKEAKAWRGLGCTRYASVNKRVRFLEDSGYLKKIRRKRAKASFEASTYELSARALLAIILSSSNLDELLRRANETTASAIMVGILDATQLQQAPVIYIPTKHAAKP